MPSLIAKRQSRARAKCRSWGIQRGRWCRRVPSPLPPRQPLGRVWSPSPGVCAGSVQVQQRGPGCTRSELLREPQLMLQPEHSLSCPDPGAGCGASAQGPWGGTRAASPSELQGLQGIAPRGTRTGSVSQSSPAPGTHKLWWEADGVYPGSVGQTPLCPRSSCTETAFSNATGILQRNLLSLEGPAESDSHLREFAGKWPSTTDI